MALIKCKECGKEISDTAAECIHCGCPIKKNKKNICINIWLITCIITCVLISCLNLFDVCKIFNVKVVGFSYNDVMAFLALMLGIAYAVLLKLFTKKSFYLLLGINIIILLYNILSFEMIINLYYIILVIINISITFFLVRKQLKQEKYSLKDYLPLFLTLILIIVFTLLISLLVDNTNNNMNIKKFTPVDKSIFPFDTIDTEQQFFDVLSENNNIVLAVKDTCEYSKNFSPIVKEVADIYNLKVYTLNVESLDNWTLNNKKSEEVITIEATPTLFIKNKNNTIEKIEGFYEKEELINTLQTKNIIEDKRTPKEKIVEYLEKNKSAICDDTKCTYSFTTPGYFSDTIYYTLDFVNKKFYDKSYNYGSTYIEYNYGNNTGYAKQVNTVGWTTTTEVSLTYNDVNNTYNWTCNSNLNGSCEETGSGIAEMTDRKRTELYDICNKLGIKANEI